MPKPVEKMLFDFQAKGHDVAHYGVMDRIGFGRPVQYYEGSSALNILRRDAARRLADAISAERNAGSAIHLPSQGIVDVVHRVAEREGSGPIRYGAPSTTLRSTYSAASDAIAIHVIAAGLKEKARESFFLDAESYLRKKYLSVQLRTPRKPN